MALHPTRKQINFHISTKKRILDYSASSGIYVTFASLPDIPFEYLNGSEYDKWVIVEIGDKTGEDIVEHYLILYLFTKNDSEYDKLAALEDTVMEWFTDATGELSGYILYNTETDPFEEIGGVNVYQERVSDADEFKGGVKFKTITLLCKWAAR